MEFFSEFIKGLITGIGIITGMVGCLAVLIKRSPDKQSYDVEQLHKAFLTYLQQIREDQQWEQVNGVQLILENLEKGQIPKGIDKYEIKTDRLFKVEDSSSAMLFGVIKRYTVLRMVKIDN